jgi:hypothetical protein
MQGDNQARRLRNFENGNKLFYTYHYWSFNGSISSLVGNT